MVVGSFAFVGFDGFFVVAPGLDVVPAGAAATGLGLAPPVGAAGVAVAAGAGVATTGAEAVVVGAAAAAVVVAFLGCRAGLCCLAWRVFVSALALAVAVGVAVLGVLVAAAGCALVFDFVEPPLPQPAATTATAAVVQIRARFTGRTPVLSVGGFVPGLPNPSQTTKLRSGCIPQVGLVAPINSPRPPRLRVPGHDRRGEQSMADAHRAMR